MTVRDLIVAMCGGLPEQCGFCDQPTPPERLHPEEGGEWACEECLRRWDEEEKLQRLDEEVTR